MRKGRAGREKRKKVVANAVRSCQLTHKVICLQNNLSCIKCQTSQTDQLDTSWINNLDNPAIHQLKFAVCIFKDRPMNL